MAADEAVGVHGAERARSRAVVGNWDLPEVEAEEKGWGRCGRVGEWAARAANKLRRRILKNTLLDWIGVSFADKALLSEMLNSRSQSKLPITMPACTMTWIRRHAFAAAAASSNHGQITPHEPTNKDICCLIVV
jgi:hypothetical protein